MQLTTSRLLLRDFVESDVAAVFGYQSDPRYLELSPWGNRTEEDARAFVARLIGWAREAPRTKFQLAIVHDEAVIGTAGIRKATPGSREAEFGCELDPRYWGNGYAVEAGAAMLQLAFVTMGLHRVYSDTLAENAAALAIATKLGMKRSGELREPQQLKERSIATIVLEISKDEWARRPRSS